MKDENLHSAPPQIGNTEYVIASQRSQQLADAFAAVVSSLRISTLLFESRLQEIRSKDFENGGGLQKGNAKGFAMPSNRISHGKPKIIEAGQVLGNQSETIKGVLSKINKN